MRPDGGMKVIRSIHETDARRCIDILQRPDGSLTFREFRRDPEDGGRWFMVADYADRSFSDEAALLADAKTRTGWMAHEAAT